MIKRYKNIVNDITSELVTKGFRVVEKSGHEVGWGNLLLSQ